MHIGHHLRTSHSASPASPAALSLGDIMGEIAEALWGRWWGLDSISLFLCFAPCPSSHDHYNNHPWASTAWWLHHESLAFCPGLP